MFRQLLTGWNRSRRTAPLQKTRRCRLAVEQLEDRLVPTTVPAIIGLQNSPRPVTVQAWLDLH